MAALGELASDAVIAVVSASGSPPPLPLPPQRRRAARRLCDRHRRIAGFTFAVRRPMRRSFLDSGERALRGSTRLAARHRAKGRTRLALVIDGVSNSATTLRA